MNINELLKQVPTDCSGKWVNIRDLPDYTKFVIEQCLGKIDDPLIIEKVKQQFELRK